MIDVGSNYDLELYFNRFFPWRKCPLQQKYFEGFVFATQRRRNSRWVDSRKWVDILHTTFVMVSSGRIRLYPRSSKSLTWLCIVRVFWDMSIFTAFVYIRHWFSTWTSILLSSSWKDKHKREWVTVLDWIGKVLDWKKLALFKTFEKAKQNWRLCTEKVGELFIVKQKHLTVYACI